MSRNYALNTFLRLTPNKALKDYFHHKGLLKGIDFDALDNTEVEPIERALDNLPEKQPEIEAEFRKINEIACEKGIQLLIEEAIFFHNLDFSGTFDPMESPYEKAMWVFLNHPKVFQVATCWDYMDRVGGWKRRYVGEGLKPAIEEKDIENLAQALSKFYKKQGRGRHCKVYNYKRGQPERECYFAYPEDYATADIEYDEKGQYLHRPRRPAFELIFVYKPDTGDLEVYAKGKADEINKLQETFCQTILNLDKLPDKKEGRFDLSKLKDKDFSFRREPQDGIEKVTVKMLRLDLLGSGNRRITFEASSSNEEQPVYVLIEKALNKSNIPLDKVVISRVKLEIKFSGKDGKKGKTLTFEISAPDRWTLRDDSIDQIAKKYVQQWGFMGG